jgi:hypothetical protein
MLRALALRQPGKRPFKLLFGPGTPSLPGKIPAQRRRRDPREHRELVLTDAGRDQSCVNSCLEQEIISPFRHIPSQGFNCVHNATGKLCLQERLDERQTVCTYRAGPAPLTRRASRGREPFVRWGSRLNPRERKMFIVTVTHNGQKWPLRGTIIAFDMERAQKFATREAAQMAIEKARKFHKASVMKTAKIEAIEVEAHT